MATKSSQSKLKDPQIAPVLIRIKSVFWEVSKGGSDLESVAKLNARRVV